MKIIGVPAKCIFLFFLFIAANFDGNFKEQQLRSPRVRIAFQNKEKIVEECFKTKGLKLKNSEVYLRAFKHEKVLELWAKEKGSLNFTHVKDYSFCTTSGTYGPKRKQGDKQIPEGFYYIDRFNPSSFFHLSLGINYPNQSDKILCGNNNPGGDIFIHGACVTIGCIPITDDKIEELYVIAVEAKNNGQAKIPVHIFPSKLKGEYVKILGNNLSPTLIDFWENLREGYEFFERNRQLPIVSVQNDGKYIYLQK